jgi:hypothetical protein
MPSALTPKLGVTKCAHTHPCDKSLGAEIDRAMTAVKPPSQNRTDRETDIILSHDSNGKKFPALQKKYAA